MDRWYNCTTRDSTVDTAISTAAEKLRMSLTERKVRNRRESMFLINYKDPRPVYEQIKDGFKKMILSGVLENGEKMPSVRTIAMELSINPNTIQRAYRELEQEGFIYSVAGKGSFVGDSRELNDKHKDKLFKELDELLTEMKQARIAKEQIVNAVDKAFK